MISRTGVHALKALAVLAQLPCGRFEGAADLAEQIGAPRNYLGKLLQTLSQEGVLKSQKGKGGGFRLARPPEDVSLFDVIEPIERVSRWNGCFLGRDRCSDEAPCPVHSRWGKLRDTYLQFLRETTVRDLTVQDPADRESRL